MPFALLALLLSAGAVAGSFYLSLEMNLKACASVSTSVRSPAGSSVCSRRACWLSAIRARSSVRSRCPWPSRGWAWPGSTSGSGWTAWPRQDAAWYLACPAGIEGIGTAPQQSFAAFALITAVLLIGALGEVGTSGRGGAALFVALAVGAGGGVRLASCQPADGRSQAAPGEAA